MPNFKSVVLFPLVDFGGGYLLVVVVVTCCDGGKTKSTPSPTDLDWTLRLGWSLTKFKLSKRMPPKKLRENVCISTKAVKSAAVVIKSISLFVWVSCRFDLATD